MRPSCSAKVIPLICAVGYCFLYRLTAPLASTIIGSGPSLVSTLSVVGTTFVSGKATFFSLTVSASIDVDSTDILFCLALYQYHVPTAADIIAQILRIPMIIFRLILHPLYTLISL